MPLDPGARHIGVLDADVRSHWPDRCHVPRLRCGAGPQRRQRILPTGAAPRRRAGCRQHGRPRMGAEEMGPGRQARLPRGRDGDGEVRRRAHRRLHGDRRDLGAAVRRALDVHPVRRSDSGTRGRRPGPRARARAPLLRARRGTPDPRQQRRLGARRPRSHGSARPRGDRGIGQSRPVGRGQAEAPRRARRCAMAGACARSGAAGAALGQLRDLRPRALRRRDESGAAAGPGRRRPDPRAEHAVQPRGCGAGRPALRARGRQPGGTHPDDPGRPRARRRAQCARQAHRRAVPWPDVADQYLAALESAWAKRQ